MDDIPAPSGAAEAVEDRFAAMMEAKVQEIMQKYVRRDDEGHGLVVQVLSKSYAPPAVQRAVDAYLRGFPQVVRALTAAEFDTSRQALVTRLLEPQRTLAEAFHHQWAPIDEEHLEWDAKVRLAGLVGLVTQAEAAELLDEIG